MLWRNEQYEAKRIARHIFTQFKNKVKRGEASWPDGLLKYGKNLSAEQIEIVNNYINSLVKQSEQGERLRKRTNGLYYSKAPASKMIPNGKRRIIRKGDPLT